MHGSSRESSHQCFSRRRISSSVRTGPLASPLFRQIAAFSAVSTKNVRPHPPTDSLMLAAIISPADIPIRTPKDAIHRQLIHRLPKPILPLPLSNGCTTVQCGHFHEKSARKSVRGQPTKIGSRPSIRRVFGWPHPTLVFRVHRQNSQNCAVVNDQRITNSSFRSSGQR